MDTTKPHTWTAIEQVAPRCYFCPAPSREPVTYVRWKGHNHYGFLCAPHRAEHAEHVASETSVEAGIERLRRLFVHQGDARLTLYG